MKLKVKMSWAKENSLRFDRNLNSFYMLLQSNDSSNIFPQNTIFNFRNKLNRQYNLSDDWVVALCDLQLHIGEIQTTANNIYIYCDIITETQIGITDEQLLRRVPLKESDISHDWLTKDFQTHYYIPLKTNTLTEIGIQIQQSSHTPSLHNRADKNTSLLLHFKKNSQ